MSFCKRADPAQGSPVASGTLSWLGGQPLLSGFQPVLSDLRGGGGGRRETGEGALLIGL